MSTTTTINMHGDHVASCLCCKFLNMGYEGDYSDVTPGEGEYCHCLKNHFWDLQDHHQLVILDPTCPDFEATTT